MSIVTLVWATFESRCIMMTVIISIQWILKKDGVRIGSSGRLP